MKPIWNSMGENYILEVRKLRYTVLKIHVQNRRQFTWHSWDLIASFTDFKESYFVSDKTI